MVEHCPNCYCPPERTYFGMRRRDFIKTAFGFGTVCNIILFGLMLSHLKLDGFSGWNFIEIGVFYTLFICFVALYGTVFIMESRTYFEFLQAVIYTLYEYICDGLRYIRDHMRMPSCQYIRNLFSRRRNAARTSSQQVTSNCESDSDDERPPLPPKSRRVTEAAARMTFQQLKPAMSHEVISSTVPAQESEDSSSSILDRPQCSKKSVPSQRSSGRRNKSLGRDIFRNMMLVASNLTSSNKDSDPQVTFVSVPLSLLTQGTASYDETEEETSFTTETQQTEATEQEQILKIDETNEHMSAQGVFGLQTEARKLRKREDHRDLGLTQVSVANSSEEEQWSDAKDYENQSSPKRPSTSSYVPFSELQTQAQASTEEEVQRTQDSEVGLSGSRDLVSRVERSHGQSSSYIKFTELEKQSREFGIKTEKQSSPKQPTSSYVPLSILENQAQKQTSPRGSSDFHGPIGATGIQRESSASYIGLPELERQSREYDTRGTERIPRSPKRHPMPAYVKASPSQTRQKTSATRLSYQEQLGAAGVQRKSSASYVRLPELERESREYDTRSTEEIPRSPEQHPMPAYVKISPSQTRQQTSTTQLSYQEQLGATGVQRKSSASYVRLPELKRESREYDTRGTERIIRSPEQQPMPAYVKYSPSQIPERRFCSSLQQAQEAAIQRSPDQAVASYVGLSELKKQSREFGITTEKKSSSELQSNTADDPDTQWQVRTTNVQRRRSSRKESQVPIYARFFEFERQHQEKRINIQNPYSSRYVEPTIMKNKPQTSGTGESREHASQATGLQELALFAESSACQGDSLTYNILNKLRNLEQASVAGFSTVTSETSHSREGQDLTLSSDYAGRKFVGKAERGVIQKRRESLSKGPICESNIRIKKSAEGSTERISRLSSPSRVEQETSAIERQQIEANWEEYVSQFSPSRSGVTKVQESGATASPTRREDAKDQIKELSSRDLPYLANTDKQETQKKETFLSLSLATGGLVLSKRGAEKGETNFVCGELSFIYDHSVDVLDLSHIEVLPPLKDEDLAKDEEEGQKLKS